MKQAVRIWMTQLSHISLLEEHKYELRVATIISASSKYDRLDERLAIVDDIITYIKKHDDPPRVFGMAIKPTLFRVLKGLTHTPFSHTPLSHPVPCSARLHLHRCRDHRDQAGHE